MKYFLNADGKVHAFEKDGSQDHLIKKSMSPITQEEADTIIEKRRKKRYNSLSRDARRAAKMPPIGDQLDAILKWIISERFKGEKLPQDLDNIIGQWLAAKREESK